MKRLLSACVMLFVLASISHAATFYVATNGSDNRNNSQAQNRSTPWRTIQRGLDSAGGGDEVVVLDGTYYEQARFRRSGSAGADILLRSENREGARVIGSIAGYDVNYVVVEGFDVTNNGDTQQTKGIAFGRCHHVTVRNNRVRNCFGGGIGVDQSDWILIEWNVVHENAFWDVNQHSGISVYQPQKRGSDSRDYAIVIRNNTSFANWNRVDNPIFGRPTDGNGIVLDDFYNQQSSNGRPYNRATLVENNLCFDNGGQGIHTFLSQFITIRNNTCVNNMGSFDFGGEVSLISSRRVYYYNNILVARPGKRAAFQYQSTQFWMGYSVIDGPYDGFRFANSNFFGPAMFRSGSLFEPEIFSPAINRGYDAGDHFFLDVNGRDRIRARIDIGANELQN